MANIQLPNIIISGATGWLGQELLAQIEADHSLASAYKVLAISSNARISQTPSGRHLPTQTYENFECSGSVEGFVNLAFLTREKVNKLGHSEYVLRNLKLISQACQVIENQRPKWVVLVSSGAIFKNKSTELETDISRNPYGFLKRIEELLITDAATRVGANVVIGRLWGATGKYMPINRAYAISDFICQALEGGPIQVRSGGQVFRRFCDGGEFMNVLFRLAKAGESHTLDSGGPLVEIGDLASEVASHFGGVAVLRAMSNNHSVDDYFPRSRDFDELAKHLQMEITPISGQINLTVSGHLHLAHS